MGTTSIHLLATLLQLLTIADMAKMKIILTCAVVMMVLICASADYATRKNECIKSAEALAGAMATATSAEEEQKKLKELAPPVVECCLEIEQSGTAADKADTVIVCNWVNNHYSA